ncbi:hypothetical protein SESBI_27278 [Sesbania bispinosa]|nr:hypothetical protein SESBI_27278 [Sesbania bispinosa]
MAQIVPYGELTVGYERKEAHGLCLHGTVQMELQEKVRDPTAVSGPPTPLLTAHEVEHWNTKKQSKPVK